MMSGDVKLAGIMGSPVSHSLSPRLHGYWLSYYGIDGAYVPLPVQPRQLKNALRALSVLGFRGANLTLPHKEAALGFVDHIEPLARRVGAVNTIIVCGDGSLEGRNTDAFGFKENLRTAGFPMNGAKTATVLGAGGAARAAITALQDTGFAEIQIINRTRVKANECAAALRRAGAGTLTPLAWGDMPHALEKTELLVNATSLGMEGQPPLDIDIKPLPKEAWVADVVYAPLMTGLLQKARQKGHPVIDGLGMLLHQARPGFAAWFGVEPEVTDALRRAVLAND
jgi:shikimate dehydrogenase